MNFFEHQDRARATTRKLVLLFMMAVASLVTVTTLLVVAALGLVDAASTQPGTLAPLPGGRVLPVVAALVVGVVLLGAMFRMAQLRGGGRVVAESLGGRLLQPGSSDPDERRILNVVEEMAIAAGVAVPPVYLLDDPGINAFAAGWVPEDAVIGVTRGCIHLLSRDELQGVVAHEFSHVFNGDMRLNIRLIGWLYGIMVIGMIGYYALRGSRFTWTAGRRRNGGGLLLLALGLVIVGYGGTFFGNLIKAAVSRQREYLADASAVQYTRNPEGIAGALKKIAAQGEAALLHSDVSEVSHMLFAQGIKVGFTGLFATHPPLPQRIRRIQPRWDGSLPDLRQVTAEPGASAASAQSPAAAPAQPPGAAAPPSAEALVQGLAAVLLATVGEPDAGHLQRATSALARLPARLRQEVQDPLGASLLLQGLLLALEPDTRTQQLAAVQAAMPAAQYGHLLGLLPLLAALEGGQRLLLVELAVPALKQLSPVQQQDFLRLQDTLIASDGSTSLFEWCVSRLLRRQLQPARQLRDRFLPLERCHTACNQLLSALCHAGQASVGTAKGDPAAAVAAALTSGQNLLELPLELVPAELALDAARLDQALQQLQMVQPLHKPRLLKAMVACVAHDGVLAAAEGDLLRATALLLDCPLPPLPPLPAAPGHGVASG